VLEDRRERADRRLVARDDGDQARDAVGVQVHVDAFADQLPADQREAHAVGAVELPVGDAERVNRRDQPHGQILAPDALRQRPLDRGDLSEHAEVTLAIAEASGDPPHGRVDLRHILAEEAGGADSLDVAAGVVGGETLAAQTAAILGADRDLRSRGYGRGNVRRLAG
jgi:hypothetical protein